MKVFTHPTLTEENLNKTLCAVALEQGFPLSGSVDLELAIGESQFQEHVSRFDQWLAAGHAGEMHYLGRGRDRRADPRLVFPTTKSIFCVAMPYLDGPSSQTGPLHARYINGKDYHLTLKTRLDGLMESIAKRWDRDQPENPLKWKTCVDSSAVLERTWAALAGLGWIGKNTLLIHPKYGSFLFLAEVLLNQRTHRAPAPIPNYCGHCDRCLRACPTNAFPSPGVLDSNQCISYWTLEKRGGLDLAPADRNKIGRSVAGCDLCQDACPFNQKVLKKAGEYPAVDTLLRNTWKNFLTESEAEYRLRVHESALNRVKPGQYSRNLAIALTNSLESQDLLATDTLDELRPLVHQRYESERDPHAQQEWEKCALLIDQISDHRSQSDSPPSFQT